MNKKLTVCLVTVALLILAGCGSKTSEATEETALKATQETTQETTLETTPPTTATISLEQSIAETGGIEDSIFDDDVPETTQPSATKPQEKPDSPGLDVPDAPDKKPENGGSNNKPSSTEPTAPTVSDTGKTPTDYEKFQAQSPSEQQKFMESFSSVDAFFAWYNNAKTEHEALNPPIEIGGGGEVDLGKLPGDN